MQKKAFETVDSGPTLNMSLPTEITKKHIVVLNMQTEEFAHLQ